MKNVSVDKCLGNECACTLGKAKKIQTTQPSQIVIVGTMGPPPEILVQSLQRRIRNQEMTMNQARRELGYS